jgi:hypothetical protein
VTLDHFVMVRIHARQLVPNQGLTPFTERAQISVLAIFSYSRIEFRPVQVEVVHDYRVLGEAADGREMGGAGLKEKWRVSEEKPSK